MCWAETTPTHSLKQQPVAPLNDLPFLYLNEASVPTFISVNVFQRSHKGSDLFPERNEWFSFGPGNSKVRLMESSHENMTCHHVSQICSAHMASCSALVFHPGVCRGKVPGSRSLLQGGDQHQWFKPFQMLSWTIYSVMRMFLLLCL